MNNILSLSNFDEALARKDWNLKQLADEYDKKYPDDDGKTVYNTLRKWRSREGNPRLKTLVRVCDLLDCDIDYLLGRIEKHTHVNELINKKAGLSEPAIESLIFLNQSSVPEFKIALNIINELLSIPDFSINLMVEIKKYIDKYNEYSKANALTAALPNTTDESINLNHAIQLANQLKGKRIEQYEMDQEVSLWIASKHFTRIIESLINTREAPSTN